MSRSWPIALACLALATLAGCGSGGDDNTATVAQTPGTSPTTATTATTQTTPGFDVNSPGQTVRAFLNAYASGDATAACALTDPAFVNRGKRGQAGCRRAGAQDSLAGTARILGSTTQGQTTRITVRAADDKQLAFVLRRADGGWRVVSIKAAGRP